MKFALLSLHVQISFSSSYILNTLAGYVPVIEYIWLFLFQTMYFQNS